jgi:hypothetical protein
VDRARASGRLRADAVAADLQFVLEGCAALRAPTPERTSQLRRRCLAMMVRGLTEGDEQPLPGPPPQPGDFGRRWQRS